MPFAEWMPRLEVQVAFMDRQHRNLFAGINRLYDAYQSEKSAELLEVFGFLRDYASRHFQEEEDLMERTCYPEQASHRRLHQAFRAQIQAFGDRLGQAPHSVALELLAYLRDWLVHHIGQEDRRLGAFLRGKGIF